MATSLFRGVVVGQDRTLRLHVPDLRPGQRVRVTIEPETVARAGQGLDTLTGLAGERLFKTSEEVDSYIRIEREAWER